ncbi:DBH-like monooxygenase protein 1 isoform X2 [Nematostella vectensis]|uniref:DBH-like monooxygenase protein 1 isoform X2 n=1 Tax=Nematostella vectensis TaxID=45351 RepID=UPI002076FB78|nr:DBH-like monooxygenase protein 1 isoform X2 [Nematostella vectensis]
MKSVLLLLVFLFFSLGFASLDTDFANSAYLDNGKNFELFWTVHKEEKTISFAAKVKTLGWLGFGISAGTGNMVGSDVVMGWVKEGKGFLQDRYAEAKALPVLDNQQDYKLDDASEEGGYTILKFTRKYDTCDAKQDNQIKAGTVRVVYAFHADDPTSDSDFSKHTHRGSRSLLLLNVHTEKPEIPNDLQHFDILHNITVPSATTSYMCKPYVFPLFSEKRQIIKVEPIVTPGNEGYVHHTVVYGCKSTFNPNLTTVTGPCYDRINMPPDITSCAGQSSLWAWAVGAGPFFYPKHVGFAIGAGHGPRYVVMEVHYDNPSNTEGVADYSGLRFHHTAQTRMYDAGMIWAGWAPFDAMIIPPQQKEWISVGYCSGECTEAGFAQSTLPDKGINIIAILLHTHLQGVKIWTRHIRDGVELLEVARDDNYDFNFQEFQVLPEEVHVKPGDDLVQVCHYQTMDKTEPVVVHDAIHQSSKKLGVAWVLLKRCVWRSLFTIRRLS